MFKKPLKVKSNTRLKNSESKALRDELIKSFPQVEKDIELVLPKKEALYCVRLLVSDSVQIQAYVVQQRAIAFKVDDRIFPTVYFLWKFPDVMLAFTTNSFVRTKITKGADLMLAGVYQTKTFETNFLMKAAACVNTIENKASIAVGITAKSSTEMLREPNNGKCVLIYHYYGDHLCMLENLASLPFPSLGPLDDCDSDDLSLSESIENVNGIEMDSALGEESQESVVNSLKDSQSCSKNSVLGEATTGSSGGDETDTNKAAETSEEMTTEEMDELIQKCFLAALKYSKTMKVPILTSTFYKLEMITSCPLGKNLDLKKTSYKKLGQFLKHMMKLGIITVKEQKKGAECITAVNGEHMLLKEFYLEKELRPVKIEAEKPSTATPSIVESYIITPAVLPLFKEFGLQKGDQMQERDIRNYVTNYVKAHNCQDLENKRMVNLNEPHIAALIKDKDSVSWEELMSRVCGLMKSCYKVIGAAKEIEAKGKIQPITMKVETRSGNKKVTLVDNIELFGIPISEFAKECQHGVSASASTSRPPGKKSDQLMVQGNQVLFVYNLLTDKYKLPIKYIRGLEYAPKNKK